MEENTRERLVRISIVVDENFENEIHREMVIKDGIIPEGVNELVQSMVDTYLEVEKGNF